MRLRLHVVLCCNHQRAGFLGSALDYDLALFPAHVQSPFGHAVYVVYTGREDLLVLLVTL